MVTALSAEYWAVEMSASLVSSLVACSGVSVCYSSGQDAGSSEDDYYSLHQNGRGNISRLGEESLLP